MKRRVTHRPAAFGITSLAAAICLIGCNSGHLTRSAAESQLKTMMQYKDWDLPQPPELLLQTGREVSACLDLPKVDDSDPVRSDPEYALLAKAGYVALRPVRKGVWDVELTDLGKQAIDGSPYAHEQMADCDECRLLFPSLSMIA